MSESEAQIKAFHQAYLLARSNKLDGKSPAPLTTLPVAGMIASDKSIDCRPRCTFCCHLRVSAYPHEVIGIFRYLHKKLTQKELNDTKQRVSAQFNQIRDLSPEQRRTMNVTCPLLVDDLCSVHPVRPLSCAGHHSTDAAICRNAFMHPEVTEITYEHPGIPMIQSIEAEQAAQEEAIQRVIKTEGEDPKKVELIAALHALFAEQASAE